MINMMLSIFLLSCFCDVAAGIARQRHPSLAPRSYPRILDSNVLVLLRRVKSVRDNDAIQDKSRITCQSTWILYTLRLRFRAPSYATAAVYKASTSLTDSASLCCNPALCRGEQPLYIFFVPSRGVKTTHLWYNQPVVAANPMCYSSHGTCCNQHICPPLHAAPSRCVVCAISCQSSGHGCSGRFVNKSSNSSLAMAQPPQPNVLPGTETPGLTKSWGTKSLSGLGWLSKLSPWSNDPVPVSSLPSTLLPRSCREVLVRAEA